MPRSTPHRSPSPGSSSRGGATPDAAPAGAPQKATPQIVVTAAGDDHLPGILKCWPPERPGPTSYDVVDTCVAIRANRVIVAVLVGEEGRDEAHDEPNVVGYLIWDDRFVPGCLFLRWVAVRPDFRRQNLLGLLLSHIVDFASVANFKQIVADIGPSNPLPREYISRLGFQEIGELKGLAGGDEVSTFLALKPHSP